MDDAQKTTARCIEAVEAARKDVEDALLARDARTRAILETTVDAIITIDEKGLIDSFNAAAERLFGYVVEEVIGQNISILMPSPYREEQSHN